MLREEPHYAWQTLDLSSNALSRLPPELGILVRIECFSIGANPISELPSAGTSALASNRGQSASFDPRRSVRMGAL